MILSLLVGIYPIDSTSKWLMLMYQLLCKRSYLNILPYKYEPPAIYLLMLLFFQKSETTSVSATAVYMGTDIISDN